MSASVTVCNHEINRLLRPIRGMHLRLNSMDSAALTTNKRFIHGPSRASELDIAM